MNNVKSSWKYLERDVICEVTDNSGTLSTAITELDYKNRASLSGLDFNLSVSFSVDNDNVF